MNKGDSYDPNDFKPSKAIKSRYAKKIVNNKFYGRISIGDVKPWKAVSGVKKGVVTQVVMDSSSYNFAIRNYDFYKDRNLWMARAYLKAMLEYMEREIKRKYCE